MSRISIDAEELEEIEDRNASLQVRLYRAQKERDETKARVAALEADLRAAIDERDRANAYAEDRREALLNLDRANDRLRAEVEAMRTLLRDILPWLAPGCLDGRPTNYNSNLGRLYLRAEAFVKEAP